MWTKKDCARQQKLAKTVKRYPSDLTDKEWRLYVLSCPLLLEKVGGAKQTCVRSSMRCAISYVLDVRGGCSRKNSGRGKLSTGGFDD